MESNSYIVERLFVDRVSLADDHKSLKDAVDLWKKTERGQYLDSRFKDVKIHKDFDPVRYQTIVYLRFEMSSKDVTFFYLKFGK